MIPVQNPFPNSPNSELGSGTLVASIVKSIEPLKFLGLNLHVRFGVEMLISLRSQPQNDLVERSDRYFVYLKPYQADDEAILRQNQFPGKPPVYIPMPAH